MKVKTGAEIMERAITDAKNRRKQALALRNTGKTVQQVADVMGISKQRASELIRRAIAETISV